MARNVRINFNIRGCYAWRRNTVSIRCHLHPNGYSSLGEQVCVVGSRAWCSAFANSLLVAVRGHLISDDTNDDDDVTGPDTGLCLENVDTRQKTSEVYRFIILNLLRSYTRAVRYLPVSLQSGRPRYPWGYEFLYLYWRQRPLPRLGPTSNAAYHIPQSLQVMMMLSYCFLSTILTCQHYVRLSKTLSLHSYWRGHPVSLPTNLLIIS